MTQQVLGDTWPRIIIIIPPPPPPIGKSFNTIYTQLYLHAHGQPLFFLTFRYLCWISQGLFLPLSSIFFLIKTHVYQSASWMPLFRCSSTTQHNLHIGLQHHKYLSGINYMFMCWHHNLIYEVKYYLIMILSQSHRKIWFKKRIQRCITVHHGDLSRGAGLMYNFNWDVFKSLFIPFILTLWWMQEHTLCSGQSGHAMCSLWLWWTD